MNNILKFEKFFESTKLNLEEFIIQNGYKPKKHKQFLYHATNKELDEFFLDPDIDWIDVDGNNNWDFDIPDGMLFLTNDIKETSFYGKYLIPFEINSDDILTIEVDSNNPSNVFDEDFNYGTKYNLYQRMSNEICDCLEVKGYDKSTFICYISDILIPRIDIAKEYYSQIKSNI